jgi:2-polyprenyl-3-methyl-5-hydroxy-6-metoxy-1,4-benzoquinol methylase
LRALCEIGLCPVFVCVGLWQKIFDKKLTFYKKYQSGGNKMETIDKEKIRETVRERYGSIAKASGVTPETQPAASCCAPSVVQKEVLPMASCCAPAADAPKAEASCCGTDDFSVEKMAAYMGKLGYSKEDLASVPDGANMMLGCGNPLALASVKPGETVVDLGSGGGFDCFLAAKEVGETGHVIGVDMTSDMISKARRNVEKIQAMNVEFRLGEIEHLPIADNTADIIMSNCVINLSPDKISVYRDAFRVLNREEGWPFPTLWPPRLCRRTSRTTSLCSAPVSAARPRSMIPRRC